MTRNHFSKHGGPYFINKGFTQHSEEPTKPSKPDYIGLVSFSIGFVLVMVVIVSLLAAL